MAAVIWAQHFICVQKNNVLKYFFSLKTFIFHVPKGSFVQANTSTKVTLTFNLLFSTNNKVVLYPLLNAKYLSGKRKNRMLYF